LKESPRSTIVEVPNRKCEVDAEVVAVTSELVSGKLELSACACGTFAFDNKLVKVNGVVSSNVMSDREMLLRMQDLLLVDNASAVSECMPPPGFIFVNSPFCLKDTSFASRDSMLMDEVEVEPSKPLAAKRVIPRHKFRETRTNFLDDRWFAWNASKMRETRQSNNRRHIP
jgi:hypothetical protein